MPRLEKQKTLGLVDLIQQIKQELMSSQSTMDPALFLINEVNVEVNFTVSGDIGGGFNLGVVTLDSDVAEERIQKITIKLKPLVSGEQILKWLDHHPKLKTEIFEASKTTIMRNGGK